MTTPYSLQEWAVVVAQTFYLPDYLLPEYLSRVRSTWEAQGYTVDQPGRDFPPQRFKESAVRVIAFVSRALMADHGLAFKPPSSEELEKLWNGSNTKDLN